MIELIVGPMFSGKTQELLRRMERCRVASMNCLLIKWERDTRYSVDKVVTHSGVGIDMTTINSLSLHDINVDAFDVIGIDEGQFFKDIPHQWALDGKRVVIAALDMTFDPKPFGDIHKIVAERVDKLTAICNQCQSDNAIYSHKITSTKGEEVIGGSESYIPLCRMCFNKSS